MWFREYLCHHIPYPTINLDLALSFRIRREAPDSDCFQDTFWLVTLLHMIGKELYIAETGFSVHWKWSPFSFLFFFLTVPMAHRILVP